MDGYLEQERVSSSRRGKGERHNALITRYDLLAKTGGQTPEEDNEEEVEGDGEIEEGTSSIVRLKQWNQRKSASLGYNLSSTPLPLLIDQVHRLTLLWRAGDVMRVDEYLDVRDLGHNILFHQLLQALIELAPAGSEERSLLESISNYVGQRGELPVYPFGVDGVVHLIIIGICFDDILLQT